MAAPPATKSSTTFGTAPSTLVRAFWAFHQDRREAAPSANTWHCDFCNISCESAWSLCLSCLGPRPSRSPSTASNLVAWPAPPRGAMKLHPPGVPWSRTPRVPWSRTPPGCHGAAPPGCHGAAPPGCHGAAPPGCHGAAPPGCHGAAPPGCYEEEEEEEKEDWRPCLKRGDPRETNLQVRFAGDPDLPRTPSSPSERDRTRRDSTRFPATQAASKAIRQHVG